jgi:hypothetical protein
LNLFCGVGRAARQERWQLAHIGLVCAREVATITTGRAAATRTPLAWLAGFAFAGLRRLLNNRRFATLDGCRLLEGNRRCCRHGLLDFTFGAEALAIPIAITAVAPALALAILAFGTRLALLPIVLLARLLAAFGTLFGFNRLVALLRLGLRRRKARVHLGHIVVEIGIVLPIRALAIHRLLRRRHDAEIVLGMLEVVLGHHRVTARLRIARQLEVFLGDMGGIAAHLHVRSIAFEIAGQRIDVLASAVPATLPVFVVLVGSHLSLLF